MSDLIIPDSRMEMPSLFQRGRKPVGKVKIDWSHPLAKGLSLCHIFQQDAAVDLVSGKVANQVNGAKWTPDGMFFDESNDYLAVAVITMNSSYSILQNINYTDNSGIDAQCQFSFGLEGDNNSINISLFESGYSGGYPNKLFVNPHSSSFSDTLISNATHPTLNKLNMAVTVSSRDAKLYYDGVLDNSHATFGVTAMADGTVDTVYLGIPSALSNYLGGAIRYTYVYDRELSPAEVHSMNMSPYQFLIPA